jgi:hypothetical protein
MLRGRGRKVHKPSPIVVIDWNRKYKLSQYDQPSMIVNHHAQENIHMKHIATAIVSGKSRASAYI